MFGKKSISKLVMAFAALTALSVATVEASAANTNMKAARKAKAPAPNMMDELNPFDPNVEKQLEEFDHVYEKETKQSPMLLGEFGASALSLGGNCFRGQCALYALIHRSSQTMYLFENGNPIATWPVSTGIPGMDTPDFDRHPNGRIYDQYSSLTYPGGNYQGLGNMPYAVFIQGGFAIHGTGKGNWKRLGKKASHGCIRVHPDNAFVFNRLVRQYGVKNVWIQVTE